MPLKDREESLKELVREDDHHGQADGTMSKRVEFGESYTAVKKLPHSLPQILQDVGQMAHSFFQSSHTNKQMEYSPRSP